MTFRAYTPEPAPEPPVRPSESAACESTQPPALEGAQDNASIALRGNQGSRTGFSQVDE